MEKKKGGQFWLKFTLVISSMALMGDLIIYPAADAIYEVFLTSDASNIALVNWIITGPSLMVIIGSLLCGILAQWIDKKKLLAISYLVFCFSALPLFFQDMTFIFVIRTLAGIAMGFIAIAAAGLIAEFFIDEKARSSMMGRFTGVMSLIGALMSFAAGYLAVVEWNLVFMVYLIAVPILVCVLLFIPKTKPEGALSDELDTNKTSEREVAHEKTHWQKPILLALAAVVLNAMYAVVLTMMAVFVAEQGIGDASTAGIFGTITTLGSMVACFAFSLIYMRLKRTTPIVFSLVMGLGFLVLAYTYNLLAIGVAVFVMGAMYGLAYSYYLMYASIIVPPSKASVSISIANAAVYAGLFLGPYICPLYLSVFGGITMADAMPFLASTCIVYTILSVVVVLVTRKSQPKEQPSV